MCLPLSIGGKQKHIIRLTIIQFSYNEKKHIHNNGILRSPFRLRQPQA